MGGYFAGCSVAQAASGVALTLVQWLFGSVSLALIFLMGRVAPGILRFHEEESESSVTYPPNKSFQGTPLRYAPELSR